MTSQKKHAELSDSRLRQRCSWAGADPLMRLYHDTEWGVPQRDSRMLWETLMLEGFQAGLAWIIVLRKREAFREAFAGFDAQKVARYKERDIRRLMANDGIIRARAKIEATIKGAQIYCQMEASDQKFNEYCWSFTDGKPLLGGGRRWVGRSALSGLLPRLVFSSSLPCFFSTSDAAGVARLSQGTMLAD